MGSEQTPDDAPGNHQGQKSGSRTGRLGQLGETEAARFLAQQGLHLLHRNWRCRLGEVDLIALDAACVVFVEVKTRSSRACGSGAEAVTATKQRRLVRLAAAFLGQMGWWERSCRFDVLALTPPGPGQAWQVEWIRDAFQSA